MKRVGLLLVALTCLPAMAQVNGHYVNGVEGIAGATLPPPGFYYRNYSVYYNAPTLRGAGGAQVPAAFDVNVFANVHRFIWMSHMKVLGATYGADIIVPFQNTNFRIAPPGVRDSSFGLGDICVEPLILGWHGKQWDAAAALGFYAPTGSFKAAEPASPGKGFWSFMPTLGGTVWLDDHRTCSVSVLGRYEAHTKNTTTNVTPGQELHFEWGVGKMIPSSNHNFIWTIGAAGYCGWQLSDDAGAGVTWNKAVHDSSYAVGPEIGLVVPRWNTLFSLRSLFELDNVDRPEGQMTAFTATVRF